MSELNLSVVNQRLQVDKYMSELNLSVVKQLLQCKLLSNYEQIIKICSPLLNNLNYNQIIELLHICSPTYSYIKDMGQILLVLLKSSPNLQLSGQEFKQLCSYSSNCEEVLPIIISRIRNQSITYQLLIEILNQISPENHFAFLKLFVNNIQALVYTNLTPNEMTEFCQYFGHLMEYCSNDCQSDQLLLDLCLPSDVITQIKHYQLERHIELQQFIRQFTNQETLKFSCQFDSETPQGKKYYILYQLLLNLYKFKQVSHSSYNNDLNLTLIFKPDQIDWETELSTLTLTPTPTPTPTPLPVEKPISWLQQLKRKLTN